VTRALFISNGHGEASIADRIAVDLQALCPGWKLDHLALVGDVSSEAMADVGPVRAMPSGGLIAMGDVRNIARDVRSGLIGLTLAQFRFLRSARGRYGVVVAVGDTFACAMASIARAPIVFVGTAKSVSVAPYGPIEERFLRKSAACFVRDDATARRLRERGLTVEPAANVIVDLFAGGDDPDAARATEGFEPALALFPGSRESAYGNAAMLLRVAHELARARPSLGAVLSIARGLDVERFKRAAASAGWQVSSGDGPAIPFELALDGRARVRAWTGPLGPILRRVVTVLGQAGTANEAAAAAGVPVAAFEADGNGKGAWYRRRQQGLLGDALAVFPADAGLAVASVMALLDDPQRRAHMSSEGRVRMGSPGAARRIAERIAAVAGARS
jgi:tetraacyldisaccharide 4'-kinase